MNKVPLATSSTNVLRENFWTCVLLYHDRPNIVNRKLAAATEIIVCKICPNTDNIKRIGDIFTREALLYEIRKLQDFKLVNSNFIRSITQVYGNKLEILESSWNSVKQSLDDTFISIRVLLGRRKKIECIEVVIIDKRHNSTRFFAVQEPVNEIIAPPFPYYIELNGEGKLQITLNSFEDADTSSAEWLACKLFPKLLKWSENQTTGENLMQSLSLVAADQYYHLYDDLKSRYGTKLVEAWPHKAKTDPQKYVFEDLAIAAYLICLWRQLQAKDVNFVDCGCGNGLLVYILHQEGYQGCGLDVRRRQIWDLFPVDLKVETVTPDSVFPNATWIIGNHSDELTPWIPVIALKSSPMTNFFVLPCCPYDFNGRKYVRVDTSHSQYNDYLQYIKRISVKCGFKTLLDKLRIPSTKRICLLGVREQFTGNELNEITEFIKSRGNSEFFARQPIEQVRNCTQLDCTLITMLVNLVVKQLLIKEDFINKACNAGVWNKGGVLTLQEIIKNIPNEYLKSLKNEYGGLQTLLKNHRYIFMVKNGMVSLRPPLSIAETSKYCDKPCWWYKNHPDGCFYEGKTCAFQH